MSDMSPGAPAPAPKAVQNPLTLIMKIKSDTAYQELKALLNQIQSAPPDRNPIWVEAICAEGSQHVRIEGKSFMLSAEGELMPAKKGQEPPSLRHFDQSKK